MLKGRVETRDRKMNEASFSERHDVPRRSSYNTDARTGQAHLYTFTLLFQAATQKDFFFKSTRYLALLFLLLLLLYGSLTWMIVEVL